MILFLTIWFNLILSIRLLPSSAQAELSCIFDFSDPPTPTPPGKVLKLEIKLQKTKPNSINGRQPQWKMTSMKDNLNGRQPKWKTTLMEDDLNGRQPQWKMTTMKDDNNGRQPQLKMNQGKPYRKQLTSACRASKSCTELGPAQPQLVLTFY